MKQDYRHLLDGKTFPLSTGRWQTTVTDVVHMPGGPWTFEPEIPDEEKLALHWLCFQIKFTNELNVELNLKLYVELSSIEVYGDLAPLLRQEIEIWLGNPERRAELIVGLFGAIWPPTL